MATVISRDKHYKDIATKIRNVFGETTEYKPEEMSNAILNMRNVVADYENITNCVIYMNRHAKIIGNKMHRQEFRN